MKCSLAGPLSDEPASSLNDGGLQKWLSLAPLSEAGDGFFSSIEMEGTDFGEFFGGGYEINPLVA